MIPRSYIIEWMGVVPWQGPHQVEQDLLITTAIIKLYEHPILKESLAFRGGTALNKLFFKLPVRYSEDIDLVQIISEPIGSTINLIQEIMNPWLGNPKRTHSKGCTTLTYRILSDEEIPIKLKFEINTREHFSVLGFHNYHFESNSSWHTGKTVIRSYKIEELLGTKLRALYQRRKGRDLYDLYMALTTLSNLDHEMIIRCFTEYTKHAQTPISRLEFLQNMKMKLKNNEFRGDILPLLPRQIEPYDPDIAFELIRIHLIEQI